MRLNWYWTYWTSFYLHSNVLNNESLQNYKLLINKIKMKGSFTIMRPIKQRSKSALTSNMFQDPNKIEEDSVRNRQNMEAYDFVGPTQFRKKLLSRNSVSAKSQLKQKESQQPSPFNQTVTSRNPMNTTINRDTMLSSLHQDQLTQFTKQSHNLRRYKEYQQVWDKTREVITNQTHKKSPILMENNIKPLYVHPNKDKTDIINNYIVHYWEMSLRNNDPILQGHIKGHRFEKVEKQKLLQLREGIKKIENSIPILPIERLNSYREREIVLSGRNKIKRQAQSETEKTQTKFSLSNTARLSNEQVFKISYQGPKKWLGSQNLS